MVEDLRGEFAAYVLEKHVSALEARLTGTRKASFLLGKVFPRSPIDAITNVSRFFSGELALGIATTREEMRHAYAACASCMQTQARAVSDYYARCGVVVATAQDREGVTQARCLVWVEEGTLYRAPKAYGTRAVALLDLLGGVGVKARSNPTLPAALPATLPAKAKAKAYVRAMALPCPTIAVYYGEAPSEYRDYWAWRDGGLVAKPYPTRYIRAQVGAHYIEIPAGGSHLGAIAGPVALKAASRAVKAAVAAGERDTGALGRIALEAGETSCRQFKGHVSLMDGPWRQDQAGEGEEFAPYRDEVGHANAMPSRLG